MTEKRVENEMRKGENGTHHLCGYWKVGAHLVGLLSKRVGDDRDSVGMNRDQGLTADRDGNVWVGADVNGLDVGECDY